MARPKSTKFRNKIIKVAASVAFVCIVLVGLVYALDFTNVFSSDYKHIAGDVKATATTAKAAVVAAATPAVPVLNFADYDKRMLALAHRTSSSTIATTTTKISVKTATGTIMVTKVATTTKTYLWPAKPNVYPNAGALLPFNRIVAYYGNFYSKGMGVLGQYPEAEMLAKLASTTAQWQAADPSTPVIPAIDYIAVTAQGSPGKDGKYKLRMPDSQIDYALQLAAKVNGIVILDVQVGLSTLPVEIPLLKKYLSMPNVHLAIDPEFAMHNGQKPGDYIGSMDASDINWTANYLKGLVDANNLPPKVLIVHRFTEDMVTNYQNIKPLPEVQIVMDMDGWGSPAKKTNTYYQTIETEPVQFTGFKLFYKNDILPPSTRMMTPAEVLALTPSPVFIQYQ